MTEVGHILWVLLYWPGGIILGNLLASLVWSSLFEWRLHVHHGKMHAKLDHLHEKVDTLHKKVEEQSIG